MKIKKAFVTTCAISSALTVISIITFYSAYSKYPDPKSPPENPDISKLLPEKVIHLDLKGAPPLMSYFRDFFPFIKKLGVTGILIEYEDMFPYWGPLEQIKAGNAYTRSDIREILHLAETQNLTVIPLIQVWGHFEFVLKLEPFKKFREVNGHLQNLCPSHEKVGLLIQIMIDQVLELHPNASRLHIGCDEVRHLGKCSRCREVMNNNNWIAHDLYLNHVKKVASYIRKNHSRVVPIMWSDMLDNYETSLIRKHEIPSLVEPMIWNYGPELSQYNNSVAAAATLFKRVWIASAFKGATGINAVITNTNYHLRNHIKWVHTVLQWQSVLNFTGIVLTGWQRYNHFAELCELLPVGTPSLVTNLLYLSGEDKKNLSDSALQRLGCNSPIVFDSSDLYKVTIKNCSFPGFDVYRLVIEFYKFKNKIRRKQNMFNSVIVSQFNNPEFIRTLSSGIVDEISDRFNAFNKNLTKALSKIYDEYTVREWISTHVTPLRLQWKTLSNLKKGMSENKVWPRRPFLDNTSTLEKAFDDLCSSYPSYECALLLV